MVCRATSNCGAKRRTNSAPCVPSYGLAEQAIGSVVVVVHDNEQADDVEMSWISGGCKNVRNFFWTAFYEAELSHGDVGIVGKIRRKAFV
eukprot:3713809-Pleurochrysis_carterae.AAC.2